MLVLWLLAGAFIGMLNGLTRWWTVARLRTDMRLGSLALALSGMILRLGLVTGLLILALREGITLGLTAFAGLWLTRWAIVIWFGLLRGPTARRLATSLSER